MAEKIGLIGTPALCVFGSPYKIPGLLSEIKSLLYKSEEITLSFFSLLRNLLILSSTFKMVLKMSSETNVNLVLSDKIL